MNIQEIAFNIVLGAAGKDVPLERIVDAFAIRPAQIFNLPVRKVKKGEVADLTVFTTKKNRSFTTESVQSLSRNNPFIGKEISGKILAVINNNQCHLNK